MESPGLLRLLPFRKNHSSASPLRCAHTLWYNMRERANYRRTMARPKETDGGSRHGKYPIRLILSGRSGSPMGGVLELGLILVIVVAILLSCTGGHSESQSSVVRRSSSAGDTSMVVTTPPTFGKPHYYTSEPTVAPLRMSTQSECNYFVVLKDNKIKEATVDVYL